MESSKGVFRGSTGWLKQLQTGGGKGHLQPFQAVSFGADFTSERLQALEVRPVPRPGGVFIGDASIGAICWM